MDNHFWMPTTDGRDFEFTPILKPLEPFRDYMTVVTQTDCAAAEAWYGRGSGRRPLPVERGVPDRGAPEADRRLGRPPARRSIRSTPSEFGQDTPLPSIQLGIENVDASGACGFNYSCVYMGTISWSSPTTPMPMTIDPRMAFENLFGDGGSPADRAARKRANRSILDGITRDVGRLQRDLGSRTTTARLNDYLESVREIERRIQEIEATTRTARSASCRRRPSACPIRGKTTSS